MGNCNLWVLFVFVCVLFVVVEVCFLSVCFFEVEVGKKNFSRFCWLNFEFGFFSKDVNCFFFVLFLVVIVNGLLFLFMILFFFVRVFGSVECFLKCILVCWFVFCYGMFFINVFIFFLVIVFIVFIIGMRFKKNFLILNKLYCFYFVLVIVGLILILIVVIMSVLFFFRCKWRFEDDEFEEIISCIYLDYSISGCFLDINWIDVKV